MSTEEKLDLLAKRQKELGTRLSEKLDQREEIIAPVREDLDALDASFDMICNPIQLEIDKLEAEIRNEVLAKGESLSGSDLMAVYSRPRITWNGAALEGYAAAHPEIKEFRNVGKPSVSIRPRSS